VTPTRYTFDTARSCVWIDARSSLHPINTETRGLEGWVEASAQPDGTLDLTTPVKGKLQLSTDRLSSGNQLYDRELRRRIDARRYPLIEGEIVSVTEAGRPNDYMVAGDLSFHGKTRRFEHMMTITVQKGSAIELKGDYVFDIREFNMRPPSMLMLKVYPEVAVRVELYGSAET
jgi:polyisoprenoid-binding protein YceI